MDMGVVLENENNSSGQQPEPEDLSGQVI